jgi:hypothetical protein
MAINTPWIIVNLALRTILLAGYVAVVLRHEHITLRSLIPRRS